MHAWFSVEQENDTHKRNGEFSCDSECPQYQSSRVCYHVVATAEVSGKLISLVNSLKNSQTCSQFHQGSYKYDRGRGRKGSRAPPKRKPSKVGKNECSWRCSNS